MTSQFSDMTLLSNFFDAVLFLLSSLITRSSLMSILSLVLELWQFFLSGIDQKSGNRKYPRLSFAQYLETGASKEYQMWHERL